MKKKIIKLVVLLLAIYLFISAIYVFNHINFEEPPRFTSPGFSNETNIIRGIMGLPPTYHTYEGVEPIFMLQVIIKLVLCVVCIIYLFKKEKSKQ